MPNTKILVKAGRIETKDSFRKALSYLPDGEYLVPFIPLAKPKNIEEWRRLYFALRDIVYEDGGTGLTKKEIHDEIKYFNFKHLWNDEENFNVPLEQVSTASTKLLSERGWEYYVKLFKEFALENYNCYL